MPSLRQRVTTYFRQLSFIADPRDSRISSSLSPRHTVADGTFITKFLEGRMQLSFLPQQSEIHSGKEPIELPDLTLEPYDTGPQSITAACTGPDDGLTGIKRSRLHLSAGPDIDFIDTQQETELISRTSIPAPKIKPKRINYRSDFNANKSILSDPPPIVRSRENSLTHRDNQTVPISIDGKQEGLSKNLRKVNDTITDNLNKNTTDKKVNLKSGVDGKREETKPTENIKEIITEQIMASETIAGVSNWNLENEHAYGLAISLYERNYITKEPAGNPIADCYGIVVRGNSCAMALADGVNWGDGAKLAARSAVQGCLEYLDTAVFGQVSGGLAATTREVFVSLLRSFWEAHACILEVGGALSTLTVAVILPLGDINHGQFVVCSCNVGDSLGYVYSKVHGVREFTQGSHDITSMRDMRDALGALGPVDGNKPELSNLTLSMTIVDRDDIVFITSDGISDNFDPVVGKFAEPFTAESLQSSQPIKPHLAPKHQNYSTSSIPSTKPDQSVELNRHSMPLQEVPRNNVPPVKPPRIKRQNSMNIAKKPTEISQTERPESTSTITARPKFLRSHTVIEPRLTNLRKSHPQSNKVLLPRSAAGLPLVTGSQRHKLTLLRLEDLLSYGINGTLHPCTSARKLCHLLVDFATMITSAKRNMLEQRELFYQIQIDRHTGVKRDVEMNRLQQRAARKRIVDSHTFNSLPGKLDHASVVAFTVGSAVCQPKRSTVVFVSDL